MNIENFRIAPRLTRPLKNVYRARFSPFRSRRLHRSCRCAFFSTFFISQNADRSSSPQPCALWPCDLFSPHFLLSIAMMLMSRRLIRMLTREWDVRWVCNARQPSWVEDSFKVQNCCYLRFQDKFFNPHHVQRTQQQPTDKSCIKKLWGRVMFVLRRCRCCAADDVVFGKKKFSDFSTVIK